MHTFDHAIFQHIYGGQGAWLWLMAALTVIGSGWTMVPIVMLAGFPRTRDIALKLLVVLTGVAIAVFALKAIIGRSRPDVHALVFSAPTDPSFPSGHAAGAFAFAAFLAFEARVHIAAKMGLFVIAGGVALSRVVLGVHFPSDVLAGAALGAFVALGMRKTFVKKMWKRNPETRIL